MLLLRLMHDARHRGLGSPARNILFNSAHGGSSQTPAAVSSDGYSGLPKTHAAQPMRVLALMLKAEHREPWSPGVCRASRAGTFPACWSQTSISFSFLFFRTQVVWLRRPQTPAQRLLHAPSAHLPEFSPPRVTRMCRCFSWPTGILPSGTAGLDPLRRSLRPDSPHAKASGQSQPLKGSIRTLRLGHQCLPSLIPTASSTSSPIMLS